MAGPLAADGGAMVQVVVTGSAGFLGARLAHELLAAGSLEVAGGPVRPVSRMTLIDRAPVPSRLAGDPRVSVVRGDVAELLEPGAAGPGLLAGAEVIFHLAAAVSAECEAGFDLGIRANLRATESLLAACRALGTAPVVVFASSLAVFGASAEHPLPATVDDHTMPNPQTSYGTSTVTGGLSASTSHGRDHGSHPSRTQSSCSRSTVPRSRRQFSTGCWDHDGGIVGSRKNGSDSPTGRPPVGVARPVASAPRMGPDGEAPGPVPGINR
jgi:hypothetical protein